MGADASSRLQLTAVRLPVAWEHLGLPSPVSLGGVTLSEGPPGWGWEPVAPEFDSPIETIVPTTLAEAVLEPQVDHVVLMVPDLEAAVGVMATAGAAPRLRTTVRGRSMAFFRVGTVLEMIESPVRQPSLYGIALVTTEPLEVAALRLRALGNDVGDPHDAIQPGRRIMSIRGFEAGLALMSPETAVG